MEVVGSAQHDRVDILLLVQHDTEVAIAFGVREIVEGLGRADLVHIAEGHDVLARYAGDIASPLSADAEPRILSFSLGATCPFPPRRRRGSIIREVTAVVATSMRFLFIGPAVCLRLPSDPTSQWTPLPSG